MLNGMRGQPEMKNDIAVMNTLEGINSRLGEAEDSIRELVHRVENITQSENKNKPKQNKKQLKHRRTV